MLVITTRLRGDELSRGGLTERAAELSVDDDVGVSPDGGGEVGVARNVESVVFELRLFLNGPGAEIAGQLQLHKMWETF